MPPPPDDSNSSANNHPHPLNSSNNSSQQPPRRVLKPKDLEAIRRLLKAGQKRAAIKLYAGAMACGAKEATAFIKGLQQ